MLCRDYCAYIPVGRSRSLYAGVTNDLERGLEQHRTNGERGFSARYNADLLFLLGETDDSLVALSEEKRIKRWRRTRRSELIEADKTRRQDLASE